MSIPTTLGTEVHLNCTVCPAIRPVAANTTIAQMRHAATSMLHSSNLSASCYHIDRQADVDSVTLCL